MLTLCYTMNHVLGWILLSVLGTICCPLLALNTVFRSVFGIYNPLYFPYHLLIRTLSKLILVSTGLTIRKHYDTYHRIRQCNPERQFICLISHSSYIDALLVTSELPFSTIAISKKQNFYIPIIGQLIWLLGHLFIDRKDRQGSINMLNNAVALMRKNQCTSQCILVAPEGTRSKSDDLLSFKMGAFHTAINAGLDILPVRILNAFAVHSTSNYAHSTDHSCLGKLRHFVRSVTINGGIVIDMFILGPIAVGPGYTDAHALCNKTREAYIQHEQSTILKEGYPLNRASQLAKQPGNQAYKLEQSSFMRSTVIPVCITMLWMTLFQYVYNH